MGSLVERMEHQRVPTAAGTEKVGISAKTGGMNQILYPECGLKAKFEPDLPFRRHQAGGDLAGGWEQGRKAQTRGKGKHTGPGSSVLTAPCPPGIKELCPVTALLGFLMKSYPSSSSPRPFICALFHWSPKPGLSWMQEGLLQKGNKRACLVLQIPTWRKQLHFCIPLCPQGNHIPTPHRTLTVNRAGPPHHQECGISLGTKQAGMPRAINTHSPGLGSPMWLWLCPI